MGALGTVHGGVLRLLEKACKAEDSRTVRSLGWLVTGLLTEQDARLPRIALAMGLGPAGLVLCWPRYGEEDTMHVLSPDAPSVRTLPEFQRLGDVDRAFRDDKSAFFGIERVRLMKPHRLDRLLLGVAIAQVLLVSLATRLLMEGGEASVDGHGSGGLSLLQLGARYFRREAWQGRTPRLGIWLLPDEMMEEEVDERRALRAFYFRPGLEPGVRWIPPRSFEERNLMWWLPGPRKRYPPCMPIGDPPRIRGPGRG